MNAINKLLDKAREMRSLPTDMALAKELKVGRAAVSRWRHGLSAPDAVSCEKLAEMSGEPLAFVLGIAGEARAMSTDEKRVWRRLATAAALACLMLGGYALPRPVHAAIAEPEQDAVIGIMRSSKGAMAPTEFGRHPLPKHLIALARISAGQADPPRQTVWPLSDASGVEILCTLPAAGDAER